MTNPFLDVRERNYGSVGREHILAVNYTYDVPALSRYWNNGVARAVFDGWQVSGVTSALSGATLGVTYSVQGISDLTGGGGAGVDSRVDFSCDPNLSRGDRSPIRAFRTECVQPPSRATNRVGTARGDELIGPGYLNWDLSLAKNIPLGGSAASSSVPSCTTRSTTCSFRPSTRTRYSTRRATRSTTSSATIPPRAMRDAFS